MSPLGQRPAVRAVLCLLWAAGVIFGLYKAASYSTIPGDNPPQPSHWPSASSLSPAPDRSTLLVTLHPQCPCSRATVEELNRLLAQVHTRLRVEILLYQPAAAPEAWSQSTLAAQARSLPGVSVRLDPQGRESERFGMTVSGHTALYAADGRLLFSGGITRARGHAGDNAGRSAIVDILSNRQPSTSHTPVFGCSIRDHT